MKTKILKPTLDSIKQCVNLIKSNNAIAFPTDTVYGVGVSALSDSAIKNIYEIKNRSLTKALPVLIGDKYPIDNIVENISDSAKVLMQKYWPGALTIIFKSKKNVSKELTNGLNTIAVRVPNNKIALNILNACNLPIATTSANISGQENATSAKLVFDIFNNKIPLIIDGGQCDSNIASTIVDATCKPIKILREGKIPANEILKLLGMLD